MKLFLNFDRPGSILSNLILFSGIEDWADSYISSQHALLQCQDALIEANHHKQAYRLKREQEKTKFKKTNALLKNYFGYCEMRFVSEI